MSAAPFRTPLVRRTGGRGVVLGAGTASAAGSFLTLGGIANNFGSFAINFGTASGGYWESSSSVSLGGVASGAGSVAGPGGTASGLRSFAYGSDQGTTAVASGTGSLACGRAASASGTNGIAFGFQAVASNNSSTGIGNNGIGSAEYSVGLGLFSNANRYGELSKASGTHVGIAVSQKLGLLTSRAITTNSVFTEFFLNGTSSRITIPSGWGGSFLICIIGMKTDGTVAAEYMRKVKVKNVGGLTSLIGSIDTIGTDEVNGTNIRITADDTNDSLKLEAAGIQGETWRWGATIYSSEIRFLP